MINKLKDNLLPKGREKATCFFNPHGRGGITMPSPTGIDTQKMNIEVKRRCRLAESPFTDSKLKMKMPKITRFNPHSLKNFPPILSLQSP
jgi:hypothetical protein